MVRQAKVATTNGYDPDWLRGFVETIEGYGERIESAKGEYMSIAKGLRGDISDVYSECAAAGIPVKELKRVLKARRLERTRDRLRLELDAEGQETFYQLRRC